MRRYPSRYITYAAVLSLLLLVAFSSGASGNTASVFRTSKFSVSGVRMLPPLTFPDSDAVPPRPPAVGVGYSFLLFINGDESGVEGTATTNGSIYVADPGSCSDIRGHVLTTVQETYRQVGLEPPFQHSGSTSGQADCSACSKESTSVTLGPSPAEGFEEWWDSSGAVTVDSLECYYQDQWVPAKGGGTMEGACDAYFDHWVTGQKGLYGSCELLHPFPYEGLP